MQATNILTTQGNNMVYSQSKLLSLPIELHNRSLMILCQPLGSRLAQTCFPGDLIRPPLKPISPIPSSTSGILYRSIVLSPKTIRPQLTLFSSNSPCWSRFFSLDPSFNPFLCRALLPILLNALNTGTTNRISEGTMAMPTRPTMERLRL